MKVTLVRSGGFGNITSTFSLDSSKLDNSKEFEQSLLDFFQSKPSFEPTPDAQTYELTVQGEAFSQLVKFNDASITDKFQPLIDMIIDKSE